MKKKDVKRAEARIKAFKKQGVSQELAMTVSLLRARASGFDVAHFAQLSEWPVKAAAHLFYDIGGRFKIDRLRNAALNFKPSDHWESLAMNRLMEQLYVHQGRIARSAAQTLESSDVESASAQKMSKLISEWMEACALDGRAYDRAFAQIADNQSGGAKWTLAKFTLAQALMSGILEG